MMIRAILKDSPFPTVDITTRAYLDELSAEDVTADGWIGVEVELSNLNSAAATITLDIEIERSSNTIPVGERVAVVKRQAADTRVMAVAGVVPVKSGDVVRVYAESTNANDTAVEGTVRFDDLSVVDAIAISGSEAAADNVEANIGNLDAAMSVLADQIASRATPAQVKTQADQALADYDPPTRTEATADKAELLVAISDAALAGDGDTLVNHNTGGADNLRIIDASGSGIDGVAIRAYLKTDYDTDAVNAEVRGGPVYSGADGRWVSPMMLNSGLTYVIVYSRAGFEPAIKEVTIP